MQAILKQLQYKEKNNQKWQALKRTLMMDWLHFLITL